MPIMERMILPDSVVYTDGFSSYDALDVSDFHHVRINHSERFVDERNHINGIENFWNQAKRHLRRFNGVPKQSFFDIDSLLLYCARPRWTAVWRRASSPNVRTCASTSIAT